MILKLAILVTFALPFDVWAADNPVPVSPQSNVNLHSNPDPADELIEAHNRQREALEVLNTMNPMSPDYGKPVQGEEYGQPTRIEDGPFKDLYALLSNPAVQKLLRFFSQPEFAQGANEILHHPRRVLLLYVELGFFVLMFGIRIWRRAKAQKWIGRLWVSVWTSGVMMVFGTLVLPVFVLGDGYVKLLKGIIETLSKG